MAESVLLIQKDDSRDELKRFIKRFNQATEGDLKKLTLHECTAQKDDFIYWDFSQGDIDYKLSYSCKHNIYTLYEA